MITTVCRHGKLSMNCSDRSSANGASMKNKQGQGLDGIPAEVDKLMLHHHPDLLQDAFYGCLKDGIFPSRWKVTSYASRGSGLSS